MNKKQIRQEKIRLGICVECKNPAVSGKKMCAKCAKWDVEYKRRYKQKKLKLGLCHDCQNPVAEGRSICAYHIELYDGRSQKYYLERKANGVCAQCGKNSPVIDRVQCADCRDKATKHKKRRFFHYRITKFNCNFKTNLTAKDAASLWKKQKGICALTGRKLTKDNAELDHIIPKSKGGLHDITNLRWLVHEVNRVKRNLFDLDFIKLCNDVVYFSQRLM